MQYEKMYWKYKSRLDEQIGNDVVKVDENGYIKISCKWKTDFCEIAASLQRVWNYEYLSGYNISTNWFNIHDSTYFEKDSNFNFLKDFNIIIAYHSFETCLLWGRSSVGLL